MADSATRDVIFRVKFEVDEASRSAAKEAAKEVTASQGASNKAAEEGAKAQQAATRAILDAMRQHREEIGRLTDAVERQRAAAAAGAKTMTEGFKQGLDGALQLGRGLVLLKVASEENMESAARVLARFTGLFDAIKGGVALVEAASKVWQGYKAAIEAVNAAKAANTALELANQAAIARGGQSAAGSAAGGVASGAAAGAAGGIAASGAGSVGAGAAAAGVGGVLASLASLATIALVVVGALAAVAAIVSKDFREGLLELIGWTDRAADAMRKVDSIQAEQERRIGLATGRFLAGQERGEAIDDIRFRARRRTAGGEAFTNEAQLMAARDALFNAREARRRVEEGQAGEGVNIFEARQATLNREISAIDRLMAAMEERERLGLAHRDKELDAARQVAELKKQELEAAKQTLDLERQRVQAAEQTLAQLDPAQAQQVARAAARARRGEDLSFAEANRLRGLGLFDEQVRAADRRRITELGLDPVLEPARQRVQAAAGEVSRLKLDVETKNEFVLKLQADRENFEKASAEAIGALLEDWQERMIEAVEVRFEKQERELAMRFRGQMTN